MIPLTTEMDAPLGRDAGCDNARFWAAVAIFGLTGVAVVAVAGAWLALRERPQAPLQDLFAHENGAVFVDMPMLRPRIDDGEEDGPGRGSFTFLDGTTGLREVVEVAPPERFGAVEASSLAR